MTEEINNNIEENYCSFEVSKLLKDKKTMKTRMTINMEIEFIDLVS